MLDLARAAGAAAARGGSAAGATHGGCGVWVAAVIAVGEDHVALRGQKNGGATHSWSAGQHFRSGYGN